MKVGIGHLRELLISINYLYLFAGEAIWLRVESKYNFIDELFSLLIVVLFSFECQLAVKLNDERIMNGDQRKERVYTLQISHPSLHVS